MFWINDARDWWRPPCGGREVLGIALPLVISTGAFSLMLFVDRMFLLWYGADSMAAAMPAGVLHWTMVCFPLGIAMYVNTFVAQYHGAGRPDRIGHATWQGARVGLYGMPLYLALVPAAPAIFRSFGHDPALVWQEALYFQVLAFGAAPAVMCGAFSAFFSGRGVTRTVMYVNIASALVNVLLDYLWIFGRWGFPAMGIEGAGWATVCSQWFKVLVYLAIMFGPETRRKFQLWRGRRLDVPLMVRLFRFGTPNGLQFLVEAGTFSIILLKMGQHGEMALAATTLALNVNAVAFIPMVGIGIAVSTLVGQRLLQGQPQLAMRATWSAFILGLAYTSVFAVAYLFLPDLFLLGHRAGVASSEFEQIRDLTVVLLRFVAIYCFFDAAQVIFVGAIKGAGDTWFVLLITLVVASVAVGIGWAGSWLGGGLLWWWFVVTGFICMLAAVYLARFLQGRWKSMRVIEHDAQTEPAPDLRPALAD